MSLNTDRAEARSGMPMDHSFDFDTDDDSSISGKFGRTESEDLTDVDTHISTRELAHHKTPYTLEMVIHRGTNLPVGDITTSDPFVVIFCNSKLIGKTHTVYRTLNPEWNYKFSIPLLHTSTQIQLKIFDEDRNAADDILGKVIMECFAMPVNKEVNDWDFEVLQGGSGVSASGTLTISYLLRKHEHLFSIHSDIVQKKQRYLVSHEIEKYINGLMDELKASDPVRNEFLLSQVAQDPDSFHNCKDLLHELLYDVCNMKRIYEEEKERKSQAERMRSIEANDKDGHESEVDSIDIGPLPNRKTTYYLDSVPMKIIRDQCYLMSSLKLDISLLKLGYRPTWSVSLPLEDICIRLRFRSRKDDVETVTITFKNKYSLWLWTLWILLGLDLALRGDSSDYYGGPEYLPEFTIQSNHTITSPVTFSRGNGWDSGDCVASLCVETAPYMLKLGDLMLIPLDNVDEMWVSRASVESKRYNMQIQLCNANIVNNKQSHHVTADPLDKVEESQEKTFTDDAWIDIRLASCIDKRDALLRGYIKDKLNIDVSKDLLRAQRTLQGSKKHAGTPHISTIFQNLGTQIGASMFPCHCHDSSHYDDDDGINTTSSLFALYLFIYLPFFHHLIVHPYRPYFYRRWRFQILPNITIRFYNTSK